MKNILTATLVLTALFVNSCGSGPDLDPDRCVPPSWYLKNPSEEGKIYDSAAELSVDMQTAFDKAEMKASTSMATKMESRIAGAKERVQEELGWGEDSQMSDTFSNVMSQMVKKTLKGVTLEERFPCPENGKIRGYVLISYDAENAVKMAMKELEAQKMWENRALHRDSMESMRKAVNEAFGSDN
tara:strand:+ start:1562 stop:2116 length:555 start_codon:yes stop_codon:yes gene_type:complete